MGMNYIFYLFYDIMLYVFNVLRYIRADSPDAFSKYLFNCTVKNPLKKKEKKEKKKTTNSFKTV